MIKRSLSIYGHSTSLALEPEFWTEIDAAVEQSGLSFSAFIRTRDDERMAQNLSTDGAQNLASYLRVWVLNELKTKDSL